MLFGRENNVRDIRLSSRPVFRQKGPKSLHDDNVVPFTMSSRRKFAFAAAKAKAIS